MGVVAGSGWSQGGPWSCSLDTSQCSRRTSQDLDLGNHYELYASEWQASTNATKKDKIRSGATVADWPGRCHSEVGF